MEEHKTSHRGRLRLARAFLREAMEMLSRPLPEWSALSERDRVQYVHRSSKSLQTHLSTEEVLPPED